MRSPCFSGMLCFFLICSAMEFTNARFHQGINNLVKTEFLGRRKTLLQLHDEVKKPVLIPERSSLREEEEDDDNEDEEEGHHRIGSKIPYKSHYNTQKYDEKKAFLDAADKVERMMWKDYRGMDRPRLKPPINNRR